MARLAEGDRMGRLVKKWRRSGQTKTAFVRSHGLTRAKLDYWIRRLSAGGRVGASGRGALSLVPVRVSGESSGEMFGAIEIVLSGGDRVRVSPEVPAEALGRVIEVLRGTC